MKFSEAEIYRQETRAGYSSKYSYFIVGYILAVHLPMLTHVYCYCFGLSFGLWVALRLLRLSPVRFSRSWKWISNISWLCAPRQRWRQKQPQNSHIACAIQCNVTRSCERVAQLTMSPPLPTPVACPALPLPPPLLCSALLQFVSLQHLLAHLLFWLLHWFLYCCCKLFLFYFICAANAFHFLLHFECIFFCCCCRCC